MAFFSQAEVIKIKIKIKKSPDVFVYLEMDTVEDGNRRPWTNNRSTNDPGAFPSLLFLPFSAISMDIGLHHHHHHHSITRSVHSLLVQFDILVP